MSSPFVLQLKNRRCLVIGGGTVAERKINHLVTEGAAVTVVSPDLTEGLRQHRENIDYVQTALAESDVNQESCPRLNLQWRDFFLVVIATDSFQLNETFAKKLGQFISLINVVDNQELSTFFFPSVVDRGLLKIAVTTSGASPILAKKIKKHLLHSIGPEYREYVEQLEIIRKLLHENEPNARKRRALLEAITHFPAPHSDKGNR
ncbi:precorrin-2 dehydrogenase/sirohydrochlorin ferrochelatase family protein [Salipaludibacillus daqingensis]|uniref:precorrin-2 dehydrogenase/sirohydrochlorin ferrochelatase family protein n=1 Tax=Salipaludibacillus daqingensis TaxID=3041001 RepID=UPI00247585F5|nr:bifunctional precorrin-2 dehydrogenase/sirohydrochlorin ferrochelatase [Salipaludibacillus daqingensis]